jgi:UPF0755 protein
VTRRAPRSSLPPRRPPLSRLVVSTASAVITLALVAFLLTIGSLWMFNGQGPAAQSGGTSTTVLLRPGAGLTEIAGALQKAGVVRSAAVFAAGAQITGAAKQLKAGEYEFPSHASMSAILKDIRAGRVVRHAVTVPEGLTSEMVVEILQANDILTGAAPVPPEGSILPETYEVQRGEDRAAVLQRMMTARDKLVGQLWEQRKPGLPFATAEQAVTLASIVEKETGKADERPRVAAVFLNRLRQGMRLQSDPTIIYDISRGRPLGRGIRMSELTAATPYNTYVIDGLPPGPIANPGRASIAAVLDPPATTELYFVADGTGGHVFASTLADHQKNVDQWRGIERAKAPAPAVAAPPPVAKPAAKHAPAHKHKRK